MDHMPLIIIIIIIIIYNRLGFSLQRSPLVIWMMMIS